MVGVGGEREEEARDLRWMGRRGGTAENGGRVKGQGRKFSLTSFLYRSRRSPRRQ